MWPFKRKSKKSYMQFSSAALSIRDILNIAKLEEKRQLQILKESSEQKINAALSLEISNLKSKYI